MVLISRELRSLIDDNSNVINVTATTYHDLNNTSRTNFNLTPTRNLIFAYLKRRAVAVIFMVIVLMLLVTTSLFTDMGLNIGQVIFNAVSNFLGY